MGNACSCTTTLWIAFIPSFLVGPKLCVFTNQRRRKYKRQINHRKYERLSVGVTFNVSSLIYRQRGAERNFIREIFISTGQYQALARV